VSFFKRLLGGLTGGGGQQVDRADGNAFWIYVQCAACGEKIRVRVSREHDLSAEFEGDSDAPTSYRMTKEIVGQNCFRRIHVEMTFDSQKRPTEQSATGGQIITRQEYEAADAPTT
jgi:hypothetical protein